MASLFIVATPIGNLEDITLRALRVLKEVDLILCEDTRVTKKLLDRYDVTKPLLSYNEHNHRARAEEAVRELRAGRNIALVTDAGTPAISDPGSRLVAAVVEVVSEVKIVPIPGPSAVAAAASVAGFPTDEFVFLGFPPHKKGRETFFKNLAAEERTVIFYESPHRIEKTLEALARTAPASRKIVICRELTKQFETVYRGTVGDIAAKLPAGEIKGEFVVVLGPA